MVKFQQLIAIGGIIFGAFLINPLSSLGLDAIVKEMPGPGGDAAFKPSPSAQFQKVYLNAKILENGIVATGESTNSKVELLLNDAGTKASVRLTRNSYLKLSKQSKDVKLVLNEGKILVQNPNALNLNVYVGNFVAASEGTTFTVEMQEPSTTNDELDVDVEVLEGTVKFTDTTSQKEPEYILPGERVRFKFRIKQLAGGGPKTPEELEKLKNAGLIGQLRLKRLEKIMAQSSIQLEKSQIQEVQIKQTGELFNFNTPLQSACEQKIQENVMLQKIGQLRQKNKERREHFFRKLQQNRLINKIRNSQSNTENIQMNQTDENQVINQPPGKRPPPPPPPPPRFKPRK